MVSDSEEWRRRVHEECEGLYAKARLVDRDTVRNDGVDKLKMVEILLSKVAKRWM